MNTIGLEVCEVCGTQSLDHAGWFSIAGLGHHMEILPWSDEVRTRPDCRHTCCGEHLQKLLFDSAIEHCSTSFHWFSAAHHGAWNADALVPPAVEKGESVEDSIMKIIGEIDAVLMGDSTEEEEPISFDA